MESAIMAEQALFPINPTQVDYELAKEKARSLLLRVLPQDMLKEYEETGLIKITGKRGTYLIYPSSQTVILDPQFNKCIAHACLQLSIPAPIYDRMVAEYLLIKNEEDHYWITANIFWKTENEFGVAARFLICFNTFLFMNLLLKLLLSW